MAWRPNPNQHRVLTPVSCGSFVETQTTTVSFPGKKPVALSPELQQKVMQQQVMLQQQAMQQQAAAMQQQVAIEQHAIQQAAIEQHAMQQHVIQQAAIHHVIQQQAIQEHVMLQHHVLQQHVMQQQVIQQQVMQQPVVQQSHYQSLTHSTAALPAVPKVSSMLARSGVGEEFMELHSLNAFKFVSLHGEILVENSPSQWHQVIIKTLIPGSERTSVIAAINKRISPQKLIPYFFHMENNHISFFVNMCGLALKTLCRRDLKVPYYGSDQFHEIEMTLKLFSKSFNLPEALKEVISVRLDSQKKFLDLSYINTIPEIQEMLFDPCDNWHLLDQLLRVSEVMAPGLVCLRLAGNGISTLTHLWNFLAHSKWKTLRSLDLTDNAVKSTGSVSLSRVLQISEVYLDRNPLCQMLKKDSYISAIRATFPRLAKLDGTYLHTSAGLPYWKPNYIVSCKSRDPGEFADQFVEHFFTLYDDSDRMKLRGLYHKNAFFSLCSMYLDAQLTTPNARLSSYTNGSRNLFHFSDAKKARSVLTRGSAKILDRLSELPTTLHDPYSFAVDLTVFTPKCAILIISGVFRDIAKEKSSVRHFTRTFVLTAQENDEYQITNDILYISNAATREAEESFKFLKPPKKIKKNKPQPNLSECEKESMTGLVQQLTNMSEPWSRKCLEDTDWDLKEALEIFVQLYEMSKIPKSAFIASK